MAEEATDILMMITGPKGIMPAESRTEFITPVSVDKLREGFEPGQFCELRDFNFSVGVSGDKDEKKKQQQQQNGQQHGQQHGAQARPGTQPQGPQMSQFEQELKRRTAHLREAEKRASSEPVDIEPVEFTRIMDSASTLLFDAMTSNSTLPSISIVKRKFVGGSNSGNCYLRLDFEEVLLTKLEWKDQAHILLESGEFLYRTLKMRYRAQKPDGSLSDNVIPSSWTMKGRA